MVTPEREVRVRLTLGFWNVSANKNKGGKKKKKKKAGWMSVEVDKELRIGGVGRKVWYDGRV